MLLWGWLCAAAVMCVLGWLGRGVVLRHDFGFDRAVREGVHERGSPALTWVMVMASLGASPACLSRVYLGVHYPSDVLAGYGVGLLWVATVAATDRYSRAVPAPP